MDNNPTSATGTLLQNPEKGSPRENYLYGIVAGLSVGILCAIGWVALTMATGHQFGIVAIAVGFFIGKAMWFAGHGASSKYGTVAAVISLFSIILGNVLIFPALIANEYSVGYLRALNAVTMKDLMSFMTGSFQVMDLIFYAIAAVEAFRFSFKENLSAE